MAVSLNNVSISPFSVETIESCAPHWSRLMDRFKNLPNCHEHKREGKKKSPVVITSRPGEEVHTLFQTLADTGGDDDFDNPEVALKKYFEPKSNVEYENFVFRSMTQEPNMTLDSFNTKIKLQVVNCKFADLLMHNTENIGFRPANKGIGSSRV